VFIPGNTEGCDKDDWFITNRCALAISAGSEMQIADAFHTTAKTYKDGIALFW
jgi:hypothetical protein